jgi:hypothetical protein
MRNSHTCPETVGIALQATELAVMIVHTPGQTHQKIFGGYSRLSAVICKL